MAIRLHSPSQETVQLPGTQANGHGLMIQTFTVNPQPAIPHASNQLPSQSAIGKNGRKRKPGKAGGEVKAKKVENEGQGIQRILTSCSTKSGVPPDRTWPECHLHLTDNPIQGEGSTETSETSNAPAQKKAEATKDVHGGAWKLQENRSSDCIICV
jgi:hypothetical protein